MAKQKRQRILFFEQITDSRFMDRKECLPMLQERIKKIKELLNIDGVQVNIGEPYFLEWGNKEDEGKLPPYHKSNPSNFDTDMYHIQYRAKFWITKDTRKISWDDVMGAINSVKAVPYDFI